MLWTCSRSTSGSSINQELPNPGGADYDCSKGAVRNLTHVLARELAPLRINVNNLGPGMVLTPFNQPATEVTLMIFPPSASPALRSCA